MKGVWEIKICDRARLVTRKEYTFVRFSYQEASDEAKRLARLDGLEDPMVWAATHLGEVPSSVPPPPSSGVTETLKSG